MRGKIWISVVVCMTLLSGCAPDAVSEPLAPSPAGTTMETPSPTPEGHTPSPPEETPGCLGLPETLTAPGAGFDYSDAETPVFSNASVHDPSVFRAGDTFYVIGSHMAFAKTDDLMSWKQLATGPQKGNILAPDVRTDFAEALEYAQTNTFWAGDIQEMPNGQYYMYYCNCEGSKPLGCIGLAVADNPEGPYENRGVFLKSGMNGNSEDGTRYNANIHPNAIDPHAFFDNDGVFWMVYGSYSGGIYILRMDEETGLPLPDQGYGKKLLGKNHSRIEGPYILYSPETAYYYLFLSFGGLGPNDGYNIRVARSQNPDGPYEDARGQDMINCGGPAGSFFDDKAIEPYGTKIIGGYQFQRLEDEPGRTTPYRSPGHNSAYYDPETGKYFLIFHTRFTGDGHEIRVHEMFLNGDGWFCVAPFRYDGSSVRGFSAPELVGAYKLILHGQDINKSPNISETVYFYQGGRIGGAYQGQWSLGGDGKTASVTLDGVAYGGVFLRSYDKDHEMWVNCFTVMSADGLAVWGAGAAIP